MQSYKALFLPKIFRPPSISFIFQSFKWLTDLNFADKITSNYDLILRQIKVCICERYL